MREIQAAVFRDTSLKPSLESLTLGEPGEGEVIVRMTATGICHTDLKVAGTSGFAPRPVVLGHEGAGIVDTVGPGVDDLVPGDPVVMSFTWCGKCRACLDAEPAVCHNYNPFQCERSYMESAQGPVHGDFFNQSSFATCTLAKRRGVVKVRKDAPLERLGPLGCGIQTGAGAVLNVFRIRPGQSLAVFGAGSLGLSAVMAAKLAGAGPIIAIDIHPNRVQMAAELGADHVILAEGGTVKDQVVAITGEGVDFALDTTTVAAVMLDAIDCLAVRGTFGYVAPPEDTPNLPIPLRPLMEGRRICGITQGNSHPDIFIPQLIDYHLKGLFPFDRMIRYYPFEQIEQAFHDSETGHTIKPVLLFH